MAQQQQVAAQPRAQAHAVGPPQLRRLAKQAFDSYVPPHVQQRPWTPPTWGGIKAVFRRYIHTPGLPIRRWALSYTREVC